VKCLEQKPKTPPQCHSRRVPTQVVGERRVDWLAHRQYFEECADKRRRYARGVRAHTDQTAAVDRRQTQTMRANSARRFCAHSSSPPREIVRIVAKTLRHAAAAASPWRWPRCVLCAVDACRCAVAQTAARCCVAASCYCCCCQLCALACARWQAYWPVPLCRDLAASRVAATRASVQSAARAKTCVQCQARHARRVTRANDAKSNGETDASVQNQTQIYVFFNQQEKRRKKTTTFV